MSGYCHTLKLECMLPEDIMTHLHHPGSRPPPVHPCNIPNASESKTSYTHYTTLRVAAISATTNTLYWRQKMASCLTLENFHLRLAHMLQFLRPFEANQSIISQPNISTSSTLKLLLVILSPSVNLDMPWSLWTAPLDTIDLLAWNCYNTVISSQHFSHSKMRQDPLHANFTLTVTRRYLVAHFVHSFTKINPPLLPALLVVSHPMV